MNIRIPSKPIDIDKASEELRARYQDYVDRLNKPILTIAPSSIAATVAFVGAIADTEKITNINGVVLVSSWGAWLLSIIFILLSYALVLTAVKEPMEWAERFSGYDFSGIQVKGGSLQEMVEQNRELFRPKSTQLKWSDRFQWVALVCFALGFICFFVFISMQLLW